MDEVPASVLPPTVPFDSMKPFEFKAGAQPWQTGTLLHWYVEVDWADPRHQPLSDLVTKSNQALLEAGFPITPVEPKWLHITVDQISVPADAITTEQRDTLVEEVSAQLGSVEPFTVTVGSLLSYHSGVIADLAPDEALAALHTAARAGTQAALGDEACRYQWGLQHLTTAYANPRELHQTGGNALVARSWDGDSKLRGAYSLAV